MRYRLIFFFSLLINTYGFKAQPSFLLNNPNLKTWIRSDTLISLNPDSTINSWGNIVSSVIFSPQSSTQLPKLKQELGKLNNRPVVYFDGINDGLISQSKINLDNNLTTIIFIGKILNPSFFGHLVCYGTNLNGDWNIREVNNTGRLSFINSNVNIGAGTDNTNGTQPNGLTSQLYLSSNFTIISAIVNPNNSRWGIYENFTNKDSANIAFTQAPNNFISMGYRSDAGLYANFEIAELMIFDSTLINSQIKDVKEYIQTRYSQKVNLGPNIQISNNYCDTTLLAGTQFSSYSWSTGANTQTISVNSTNNYWLEATDVYGLISIDTINVSFPNYNKPSRSAICSNNTLLWNTNLPKNQYTFQWQDNSSDSLLNINQAGDYYVKITDSYSCSVTSDTAHITIDNFSNIASLGPDLSLCAGNTINLVSGVSPSLTYTWSTGSNNDSLLINNSGQYSVVITNTNSCIAKDTINVTIIGLAPVANFTSSIGCKNDAVAFTDLSVPPSGNTISSYDWNFGDLASGAANTSTLSNPYHTFSDTGNYSVTLKIITNVGCEQFITKTIHIAPKPIVNFVVGLSCQNDSTAFFGSVSNPTNYFTSSLNWNFGDPSSGNANSSNIISPKHLFSNQANYTIKLIATNNAGCKDSLINIITVKAQVKADFTYSSACTNAATLFQDNSIVPAPNSSNIRSWNFGTSTANGLTVSKSYTNSGVYSVTLSVTGNNGCNSSISKIITIFSPPVTSFTIPAFCAKDTITAINSSIAQSGIISSYNWKLNNTSFSSIQNPTLSISTAGSYPINLIVINNFGCRDSLTKTITVNPLPIVDFTTNPSSYYYINSQVSFIPSINNATFYFWNISTAPTTTIQSPTVTFTSEGTYTASLLLEDQQGCKNSVTKNLIVTKRFLDIAILNVNSSKDADGFVSVQSDIINYGTIPASTIELNYQVSDGGNIKETWTGTLAPNNYFTYTFNSKVATQPQSTNHITCVDAQKVNGIVDEKIENNELCSALNPSELYVSNPIPNPTSSDIILPIILNKDIDFSISIYNSTGQIIYEEYSQNGVTGLNLVTIPSSNYARGCYIIKTVIDDKIFIKKFIKIENE